MNFKGNKLSIYYSVSLLLILVGLLLAISVGAKTIDFNTVVESLFNPRSTLDAQLVRDVRLPRALASLFAGGILAMAGAMMQGVTRNPIAEPSLLGMSQGATLAIAILYANQGLATLMGNMGAAFVGALLSGLLIIAFTLHNPSHLSMGKLLLAGTGLSTFFMSLSSVIALLTNQSQMLGFWLSGGFRGTTWSGAYLLIIIGLFAFGIGLIAASKINILSLGDDVATGFGINPVRVRFWTLLLIIPMCAATVAVGRNIGFVGLIVPQITIRLVGRNYKKIIPLSFCLGAVLLVYSDIVARMINSPYETPIGIFTSLIGIPFFILLVRKERA